MYRVSLAISPIDLCRTINVSSERNPRRGRAEERARKRLKNSRTTGDERFLREIEKKQMIK